MDHNKLIHEANAIAALRALGFHPDHCDKVVRKHGHEVIFRLLREEQAEIRRLIREVEELKEEIAEEHRAHSGTTSFKSKTGEPEQMDISVHVNDTPKIAVAKEWTGANGTGTQVTATGAITFKSDNEAAVKVDPNTGALTYVSTGVANISWSDASLPDLPIAAGSVTVTAAPAVSGTTEFVDAPTS